MGWRCAECGKAEEGKKFAIDAVCHHCGKPLCRTHQNRIGDDAFHGHEGQSSRAVHCPQCRRRHHAALFQGDAGQPR